MFRNKLLSLLAICLLAKAAGAQQQDARTLIIFFDGLRPDYITPDLMPNLHVFKQKGVYGTRHHSVYPTVTRVNSASYATGSYPKTHGLLGNTVYFPQVNKVKGLNTGDAADLMRIDSATGGHLLTATSLGEVMAGQNQPLLVFSSGSSGQAYLQNHKVGKGAIYNPELILPLSIRDQVIREIGTPPPYAKPNAARHAWMVDAFLKYGTGDKAPQVTALWFSDPDATAHAYGIGAPQTLEALRIVDSAFGRVLKGLDANGGVANHNILISTDHGFVTYAGKEGIVELLMGAGLKQDKDSEDVVVAEGAIYVKDHNPEKIRSIVALLQAQPWVGAIFTKPQQSKSMEGSVPGTLSFNAIHWNHTQRAADILVDEEWNDDANSFGYKGSSYSRGVAGHGGTSPYEIRIPLIASGPAFRKAATSDLPTSNIDLVPTVLYLHGYKLPASMDGRVMQELFVAPAKEKLHAITETTRSRAAGNAYTVEAEHSVIGKYRYLNAVRVRRSAAAEGKTVVK